MKVLIALLAAALAAQVPPPAPTMTADPAQVDPGATVTVTVTGCTGEPAVLGAYQLSDSRAVSVDLADQGGGTWTGTFTAPDQDVDLFLNPFTAGACGEDEPVSTVVDVEHPQLVVGPVPAVLEEGQIMGTDCPPGTDATVTLSHAGQEDVEVRPTDEQGDWLFDLPALAFDVDTEVTVTATCGAVAYPAHTYVVEGSGSPPAEEPPPAAAPSAPPAAPVPAPARFTG